MATLRHPNILQIYDIGEFNGSPYVALELLEGGSLTDRLRGTLLPPRQAAEWMVPLVLAMDAAHRAGIVHRDLKSANILFSCRRHPQDHRLRPGQAAGDGRGADAHRPGDGDAELHGSRASPGRHEIGRPARRHLRLGRDPLRDAHRPASLQGDLGDGDRQAGHRGRSRSHRRACSSACRATSRPSA